MTVRAVERCAGALVWLALLGGCRPGPGADASPTQSAAESRLGLPTELPGSPSAAPAPALLYTGESEASTSAPTAAAAPGPRRAPEPQPVRVAFIGDSLTDYRAHGGKFIRYLEEQCPKSRFDNFGKGADMVNQMRRRFLRDVLPPGGATYTHVVVFGGVNDLYSDLTAHRTNDKIQADLMQMYDWARAAGARVVAIAVTPWGGFKKYFNARRQANTLALNDWMAAQVGTRVDAFVDAHALLGCGEPREQLCPEYAAPFKDGLHIGPAGQLRLGEALKHDVFPHCE